jgi:hypothetical protein
MIFLLLSIVFSTLTVSFFKLFERKGVHTFHAIVVNYLTCGIIGSFFVKNPFYTSAFWTSPWLIYTLILGFLFISIFYLIALTAQKISVSASMVAAKLSVVIPVLIIVNLNTSKFQWFWFPMLGWGMGLTFHALETFGYGKSWEERKIQEILEKEDKQKNTWN